jgi:hypothetical protein
MTDSLFQFLRHLLRRRLCNTTVDGFGVDSRAFLAFRDASSHNNRKETPCVSGSPISGSTSATGSADSMRRPGNTVTDEREVAEVTGHAVYAVVVYGSIWSLWMSPEQAQPEIERVIAWGRDYYKDPEWDRVTLQEWQVGQSGVRS